jgi:hypothetical protein
MSIKSYMITDLDKNPKPDNLNIESDKHSVYTRDFIIKCKCDGTVNIFSTVPIRKPKPKQPPKKHHRRTNNNQNQIQYPDLVIVDLVVTENAWSENKKSDDKFVEIQKKTKGLLNKLTMKKYEKISQLFIEAMEEHTFTTDQLNIFIPTIYEIVLNQLSYNNTFSRLFKRYNNNEFNVVLIEHVMKEFHISIEKVENDRKFTSLLEEPETIKKRYALNNLSFVVDLYNTRLIDKDKIEYFIRTLIDMEKIDLLCYIAKNFYKTHKNGLYEQTIQILKKVSENKEDFEAKTRFKCKDVLDDIC